MSDLSLALTLLGASLSAALAYLPMTVRAPSILRSVFKTVPVALLAVIAWWQGGSWVLVAAFVASAMGDLALSRDGKIAFLTGMISFAVAHLAYLVVFLPFYGGVTVCWWRWQVSWRSPCGATQANYAGRFWATSH